MDFSETIEIKVVDKNDSYSIDSYFFAYFQDLSTALEQIRTAVRQTRSSPENSTPSPLIDTTITRSPISYSPPDRVQTLPTADPSPKSTGFRLTSLLRPLESLPIARAFSAPEPSDNNEEFTYISKRSGPSFVPITTSPKGSVLPDASAQPIRPPLTSEASSSSVTPTASYISNHTYPPSTSASPSTSQIGPSTSRESTATSTWSSWLRMPTRRVFGSPFSPSVSKPPTEQGTTLSASATGDVSEVLFSNVSPSSSRFGEYGFFSILEKPITSLDLETVDKFRTSFAFDEKETLLGRKWLWLVGSVEFDDPFF